MPSTTTAAMDSKENHNNDTIQPSSLFSLSTSWSLVDTLPRLYAVLIALVWWHVHWRIFFFSGWHWCFVASLALVLVLRCYRHLGKKTLDNHDKNKKKDATLYLALFKRIVQDECQGILHDLIYQPFTAVFQSTEPVKDTLLALACWSHYPVSFGPISPSVLYLYVRPLQALAVLVTQWQTGKEQQRTLVVMWLSTALVTWQWFAICIEAVAHRYFSHQSFACRNRFVQCGLSLCAATAGAYGPLWYTHIHKQHHLYCDTPDDVHSPSQSGFWYAQTGWILDRQNFSMSTRKQRWFNYPELLHVEAFHCFLTVKTQVALSYLVTMLFLGQGVIYFPWQASSPPPQFHVLQDYFFSAVGVGSVLAIHSFCFCNTLCHPWSKPATDDKQCSGHDVFWLGLINGGVGFHGRHHTDAACVQHGKIWWLDSSYVTILLLNKLGIVHKLQHGTNKTSNNIKSQ